MPPDGTYDPRSPWTRTMPLVTSHIDQWHVLGSAVLLKPGLAMAAVHVLDDCFRRYGPSAPPREHKVVRLASHQILALQPSPTGFLAWSAAKAYVGWSDIALVSLVARFADRSFVQSLPPIELTVRLPRRGDVWRAYGWPKGEVVDLGDKRAVYLRPREEAGSVLDVHPRQRESGMYRWPVAAVGAYYEDGMSGGPVFNEAGQLCGLVCGCLDQGPVRPEAPLSYASLLWPTLGIKLDHPREGRPDGPYYALELATAGRLIVDGADAVSIDPDGVAHFRFPQFSGDAFT